MYRDLSTIRLTPDNLNEVHFEWKLSQTFNEEDWSVIKDSNVVFIARDDDKSMQIDLAELRHALKDKSHEEHELWTAIEDQYKGRLYVSIDYDKTMIRCRNKTYDQILFADDFEFFFHYDQNIGLFRECEAPDPVKYLA